MGKIHEKDFGIDKDTGKPVKLYSLHGSDDKLVAEVMTYGATLMSLYAPGNATDSSHDVIIGYDNLLPFFDPNPYYGASVGRVCNRIANGKFRLNDREYQLAVNNGPNSLHGGNKGFNKKVWDASIVGEPGKQVLVLSLTSPNGDENYPGTLNSKVTYAVDDSIPGANCLSLTYEAKLAEGEKLSTIVNFTNHAYFNLGGNSESDANKSSPNYTVLNHRLAMRSSHYLPTTKDAIPTGKFQACKDDLPMDFGKDYFVNCADVIPFGAVTVPSIIRNYHTPNVFGRRFGDDIDNTTSEQIVFGKGYDHSWMLNKRDIPYVTSENAKRKGSDEVLLGAIATCNVGNETRYLAVYTSQPSIQLYTGNWLGDDMGKKNDPNTLHLANRKGPGYPMRGGFALETQHYPDSINQPSFPSVVLRPGEEFKEVTIFECGAIKQ